MIKKMRWGIGLGVLLVVFSLSSCHIRDAVVSFVNTVDCGPGTCLIGSLVLTLQKLPQDRIDEVIPHVVNQRLLLNTPVDNVVMDSGTYLWSTDPITCANPPSGQIDIQSGSYEMGCSGLRFLGN